MTNKALSKVYTTDEELTHLQENVNDAISPLLKNPLLDGMILSSISLVIGSNNVSHKLGRNLQGWIVVDKNAASDIYREVSLSPALTLKLNSSANCIVSLYVF